MILFKLWVIIYIVLTSIKTTLLLSLVSVSEICCVFFTVLQAEVLTKYLRQLRDCVSLVTKEHEQLVGIILVGSCCFL